MNVPSHGNAGSTEPEAATVLDPSGEGNTSWRVRRVDPVRIPIRRHRTPPRRWSSTPLLLLLTFLLLNVVGSAMLALPISTADGIAASLRVAFFTAISASTVTGLTVTK